MQVHEIANDRFKHRSRTSFWVGLITATLLHAAVFAASPAWAVTVSADPHDSTTLVRLPELRIPEPPPIQRPASPVITTTAVDPLETIPPNVGLPDATALAPPPPKAVDEREGPWMTPMEVAPRLLNAAAVQRALRQHYPPPLREAGIGGEVVVWFHIGADGGVMDTRLHSSSGYDSMDAAALAVAERMEFTPAYNRDRRVPVWVAIPIRFEVER